MTRDDSPEPEPTARAATPPAPAPEGTQALTQWSYAARSSSTERALAADTAGSVLSAAALLLVERGDWAWVGSLSEHGDHGSGHHSTRTAPHRVPCAREVRTRAESSNPRRARAHP
ncbi:MAG: hypothetical protein ACRDRH_20005, partial [Pseudonocardia sp.]